MDDKTLEKYKWLDAEEMRPPDPKASTANKDVAIFQKRLNHLMLDTIGELE